MINVVNEPVVSDAKILKELEGITTRDVENRNKMERNGAKASVNALQDHAGGNAGYSREAVQKPETTDAIARIEQQLGQLSITMCDMAKGKSDVEDRLKRLETKLLDGGVGGAGGAQRKFPKCEDCERDKKFCNHCKNCKETGHKQKDCPKPKN